MSEEKYSRNLDPNFDNSGSEGLDSEYFRLDPVIVSSSIVSAWNAGGRTEHDGVSRQREVINGGKRI